MMEMSRPMRNHVARTAETAGAATGTIADLISTWQRTGDHDTLATLLTAVSPVIRQAVTQTLRHCGIRDTAAVDDTLSLVFDHIRRLPATPDRIGLQAFVPSRSPATGSGDCDAGAAWICMLARSRAVDVIRIRRRRERHVRCFTALVDVDQSHLSVTATTGEDLDALQLRATLHEAIGRLAPRARMLVDLLLTGKTQAVAAHVLGVCEGTVSRMLARAIHDLRDLLGTNADEVSPGRPSAGHGETPVPRAQAGRPARARASRRRGPPGPSAPA